jgi:hypothetical protein
MNLAFLVFPLTVTVDHARVLSDIELEVLTGDLDQLTGSTATSPTAASCSTMSG